MLEFTFVKIHVLFRHKSKLIATWFMWLTFASHMFKCLLNLIHHWYNVHKQQQMTTNQAYMKIFHLHMCIFYN